MSWEIIKDPFYKKPSDRDVDYLLRKHFGIGPLIIRHIEENHSSLIWLNRVCQECKKPVPIELKKQLDFLNKLLKLQSPES
jgi:hypothetical protein